ncbi:hypothetical protein OEZ60_13670 [Defluviimonas sp. WL0024]|uniref:Lipoprotein n=1 Tax=Albidovulum salinarum TaxID=2984153 RepID=A0ABT2X542_9RHOB|nr:hypothetical protein [Defluviimonas sp. WL0024]MCU9849051.1 hypothetical protein [Defluviimonas sp. WL0024]
MRILASLAIATLTASLLAACVPHQPFGAGNAAVEGHSDRHRDDRPR